MKILFIGSVEFSYKSFKKLVSLKANIVGVCTKKKSAFNSDFKDLAPICIETNIPYLYCDNINSKEVLTWVNDLAPDIIFCFGWSSLIKKELLLSAPMGVVGYHPAELPKNRGRHPLIWAICLGLKQTASTFFFMNEGADEGDILSQAKFEIDYQDDASDVYQKMTDVALSQIEEFLPQLIQKTFVRIPQANSDANYWRKRSVKDGKIDFRMSSFAIYNLVRALTRPYVGAHIEFNDQNISVWKVEEILCDKENIESGKVLEVNADGTFVVKTYNGAVKIISHNFTNLPLVGDYL